MNHVAAGGGGGRQENSSDVNQHVRWATSSIVRMDKENCSVSFISSVNVARNCIYLYLQGTFTCVSKSRIKVGVKELK